MKNKILIINGPNLNLLGTREPDIYGTISYHNLVTTLKQTADHNFSIIVKQTNHEGKIIDWLHQADRKNIYRIIINPGAYTHYSYAIADAIKAIKTPVIEVHLTDLTLREPFRQISLISHDCIKTFMGKHLNSYLEAIKFIKEGFDEHEPL